MEVMEIVKYSFVVLTVIMLVYGTIVHNRLVMLKHNAKKAWGNIDVLLKQRHDELPKLVAVCKEYMQYEQATLERVTRARSQVAAAREAGDIEALGAAESKLRSGLGQLFALVENYPTLKANEHFQHLQNRITALEDAIADRREFYNDSVNNNNISIEVFPDVIVARSFGFEPFKLLQFEEHEKADIDIRALFQA